MRVPLLLLFALAASAAEITVPLRLDRTAIAERPCAPPDGDLATIPTIAQGGSVAVEVYGLPYILRESSGQLLWIRHYKVEGVLAMGPCRERVDLYDDDRFRLGQSFEFCGRLLSVEAIAPDFSSITFLEAAKFTAQVGLPAPAITLQIAGGGEVKLGQRRSKPLLLDFWASWCDVCLGEFPALRKLHDSGSVEIVSINIDDQPRLETARRILREQKPSWQQVMTGQGEGTSAWKVFEPLTDAGALPLHVLIDASGVLRYAGTGMPEVRPGPVY